MYYFTKNEYLVSELESKSFFFSSPLKFNDPLDCDFRVLENYLHQLSPKNIENIKDNCRSELNNFFQVRDDNIYWAFKSMYKAYPKGYLGHREPNNNLVSYEDSPIAKLSDVVSTETVEDFLTKLEGWTKTLLSEIGIKCFTDSWKNFLLWSHYAKNHRGVCVEVGESESLMLRWSSKVGYFRVNYVDEKVIDRDIGSLKTIIQEFLSTKFKEWQYESESRVISFRGKGFIKFRCDAILGITLGDRWFYISPDENASSVIKSRVETLKSIIFFRKRQHPNKLKVYVAQTVPSRSSLKRHEIFNSELSLLMNVATYSKNNNNAMKVILSKRR